MGGMPDRVGYDGKHPWNAERPAQSGMTPVPNSKTAESAFVENAGKKFSTTFVTA